MDYSSYRGIFDYRRVTALTEHLMGRLERASPQYPLDPSHGATLSAAIRKAALKKKSAQPAVAVLDGRILKHTDPQDIELSLHDLVEALPPSASAWRLGCQLIELASLGAAA